MPPSAVRSERIFRHCVLGAALVGVQSGVASVVLLRTGHLEVAARGALEIVGVHAALGALVGIAAGLATVVGLRLFGRGATSPRLVTLAGAAAAIAVFVGAELNVRVLPRIFDPRSLAADALVVLAVLTLVWLWSRRPFGPAVDRILLGLLLAADLALLAVPRWGGGAGSGLDVTRASPAELRAAPDLFVILVDTLRADHLGAYGYDRPSSPRLDAFASRSIVFERAYSSTNWTRPAVASLFTSTMPSRHGATSLERVVSPSLPLVAEVLRARGYRTGFFTSGINMEPSDGYGRGVDHFHHARSRPAVARTLIVQDVLLRFVPGLSAYLPGQEKGVPPHPDLLSKEALAWLETVPDDQPVFVYLHYLGPHSPYDPPSPFDRAFSARAPVPELFDPPPQWAGAEALSPDDRAQMLDQYVGEIAWHDEWIGYLLDGLAERGRLDAAAVFLTSDHGEGFGEHGVWGHNASLFEEVVRVPLVLWSSEPWAEPRRTRLPASLLDIAPTLVELAGAQPPESFDGASLLPWLRDASAREKRVFLENPTHDEVGIRTPEWAYFEGKTGEGDHRRWLFRADDVAQERNLADAFPEVVAELSELARMRREEDRARADGPATIRLDPERRRMLEALGYVE